MAASDDGVEQDMSAVNVLIPIRTLWPHKMNIVIYGEEDQDDRLTASVSEHGIIEPLLVEDQYPNGYRILSGHRRYRAALAANLSEVPCRVIPRIDDEIAETELIIEANRQREKTFFQLMHEASQLEHIEREKAKRRQGTRTDIVEILPQSETGKTRDKVAEKIGMSGRTYDKAKLVIEQAATGDKIAQEQVKKLDAGETSISGAYKEVQKHRVSIRVYFTQEPYGAQEGNSRFWGSSETDVMEDAYDWLKSMKSSGVVLKRLTIGNKDIPVDEFLKAVGADVTVDEFLGRVGVAPDGAPEDPEPEPTPEISRAYQEVQDPQEEKPPKQYPDWHDLVVDYTLTSVDALQHRCLHFGGPSEDDALQRACDRLGPDLAAGRLVLDRLVLDETEFPVEEFLRRLGVAVPVEESPDQQAEDLKPDEEPKSMPEPLPALTPIVLSVTDPESKKHSAGIWYQREGMEKPEHSPFYGQLTPEGWPTGTAGRVIHPVVDPGMAVRMLQWIEINREKYTIPRLRFDKTDITMDDLRFLARWGCLPEEENHTVTVHYLDGPTLPAVTFFDGAPQAAAQTARKWIEESGKEIRRIRYCDGAGGSFDTTIAGLENLARTSDETAKDREKNAKFAQKILIKGFIEYLYAEGFTVTDATEAFSREDVLALVESYLEGEE